MRNAVGCTRAADLTTEPSPIVKPSLAPAHLPLSSLGAIYLQSKCDISSKGACDIAGKARCDISALRMRHRLRGSLRYSGKSPLRYIRFADAA